MMWLNRKPWTDCQQQYYRPLPHTMRRCRQQDSLTLPTSAFWRHQCLVLDVSPTTPTFSLFFLVTPQNTALRENEMARIPVSRSLQALWKTPLRNSSPMIAKIMIINSTSKAICSSGAIAFRIDLSTTWRPATNIRSHTVKLGDSDGNFQKKHSVATTACQARVTAGCVHLCKMAGNTVIPFPYGKWHLVAAKKNF